MIHAKAKQQNFTENELNQAIMVRSKLSNKYLKSKTEMMNRHITSRETTVLRFCVLKTEIL